MDDFDWPIVWAGIVSVLSLIASIFSAVSAARSADLAIAVERRLAAAARTDAIREIARTASTIQIEETATLALVNEAEKELLAMGILAGDTGSHREKEALLEIQKRKQGLPALASRANLLKPEDSSEEAMASLQIALDRDLLAIRALKDRSAREATSFRGHINMIGALAANSSR